MSSPIVSPEASVAEQSRKQLQDKLNGLGGKQDPEARAKKLREACEGFESIFIQKMWQEMRNTVPDGGIFQSREEKFWQDMYDQELSKSMTKAGGIGLADMMYEQLSRSLVDASRSATGMAQASAFTPGAAPLVPEDMPVEEEAEPAPIPVAAAPVTPMPNPLAMAAIYDGEAPSEGVVENEAPAAPAQAETVNVQDQATGPGVAAAATAPVTAPMSAPVAAPVTEAAEKPERKTRPRKKSHAIDNGNSGIDLAYRAKRDAGDKLGSHAIRPPIQPRHKEQAEPEQAQPVSAPAPGSAEALRQAVELSKAGASENIQAPTSSMMDIVQAAKMRNAEGAARIQPTAEMDPANIVASAENNNEPKVRKVRMTTNIPRSQRAKQNNKDAIRLLNVDNTSVNSKAGQGLAAYHAAQQEAARAASTAHVAPVASAETPIRPLTAEDSADNGLSFAIPPLRGSDLKG